MKKNIYNEIYKQIEKYDNIVIARHIRIDPDAMSSQVALRDSIRESFPSKKVYAIGSGTIRFNYLGYLDKMPSFEENEKVLLIVCDTPDKKRVDMDIFNYSYSIKIDHHPFVESFCDIELIDPNKSSASEMVYDLIKNTKLVMNKEIARILFCGIVTDTNRFLFDNSKSSTFLAVSDMIDNYHIDITSCYNDIFKRPFEEMQLLGYMINNMEITSNNVGFVKITNETSNKYKFNNSSLAGLINEFNNVDELLVWLTALEDTKNECIRVSIRSRGPVINKIAEQFNGGGHAMASGARVTTFEEVDALIKLLNKECKKYNERSESNED